jgi:hypothetical protein
MHDAGKGHANPIYRLRARWTQYGSIVGKHLDPQAGPPIAESSPATPSRQGTEHRCAFSGSRCVWLLITSL